MFSDAEIDDFIDRVAARAKRMGREQPTLSEREQIAAAAGAVTKEALERARCIAKRMRIAADLARDTRRAKIDAMPRSMDGAKRLEAINVGSERQGLATSSSVDAEGRARQMSLWGQVETGLNKMPGLKDRLSNFWGVGEQAASTAWSPRRWRA